MMVKMSISHTVYIDGERGMEKISSESSIVGLIDDDLYALQSSDNHCGLEKDIYARSCSEH